MPCPLSPFGCWQSREVQEKACSQEPLCSPHGVCSVELGTQGWRPFGISKGEQQPESLNGMPVCCLWGLGFPTSIWRWQPGPGQETGAESTRKWQELLLSLHRSLSTQNWMSLPKQEGCSPTMGQQPCLDFRKQPCRDRRTEPDHVCMSHGDLTVLSSFSSDQGGQLDVSAWPDNPVFFLASLS